MAVFVLEGSKIHQGPQDSLQGGYQQLGRTPKYPVLRQSTNPFLTESICGSGVVRHTPPLKASKSSAYLLKTQLFNFLGNMG